MSEQPPDLTERLADAARTVVLNQRPDLERAPGQLRSIVVELALQQHPTGVPTLVEADCYVQRRVSVNACLGVNDAPRPRQVT